MGDHAVPPTNPPPPAGGKAPRAHAQHVRRQAPYQGANRQDREKSHVPDIDTTDTNLIKVSAKSETKAIAGKIAHDTRSNEEPPTILTIGAQSINQALKAVAVARKYLSQDAADIDLSCQPAFREGMSDLCMAIYLRRIPAATFAHTDNADQLVCKAETLRTALAGAIAARLRKGDQIYVLAKGPDSVGNTLGAICRARTFLEEDKLDLHISPRFVKLPTQGAEDSQQSTFLRVDIQAGAT